MLTRTASEAVAEICTNALVSKALSLRRVHAGALIKGARSINVLSFSHSNVDSWERCYTVGSEPYFYDSSYTPSRIKPHACQWIPYMVAQHVSLNLAIQDVASMAAKTCSLGSLCKL